MYNVDYNPSQLSIGQEKCGNIINNVNKVYSNFKSDVSEIVKAAKEFKLDVSSCLTFDLFSENIEGCVSKLRETSELAAQQSNLVNEYQRGEFGYNGDTVLVSQLNLNVNNVNNTSTEKVRATILMGAFKFGEGFVEFFEGIGDCALSATGAVCGVFGYETAREKLKSIAKKDVAVDLFENNSTFEWINENSYFDKDSHFANICKLAGTATGAIVTGKVTTKVGASLFKKEKAAKIINKVGMTMEAEGTNVANNLKDGMSLKSSFALGTMATVAGLGLESKVSNPIGEAIGNTFTNSSLGSKASSVMTKATDVFGEKGVEATKTVVKKMASVSTSEMKNDTSDVVRDGYEESYVDALAECTVDTGIDASKKVIETIIR